MATAKDCHIMTSYYQKLYQEKYKRAPVVNRHKARWGFDSVLFDMTLDETKDLLEFYFSTVSSHGHSIEWFFNNYDKLIEAKERAEKDEADRRRLREASKKRVEEWRNKVDDV